MRKRERATQVAYKPCAVRTSRGKTAKVSYTSRGEIVHLNELPCQRGIFWRAGVGGGWFLGAVENEKKKAMFTRPCGAGLPCLCVRVRAAPSAGRVDKETPLRIQAARKAACSYLANLLAYKCWGQGLLFVPEQRCVCWVDYLTRRVLLS